MTMTSVEVSAKAVKPGRHKVERNLSLVVTERRDGSTVARWVFRFHGATKQLGTFPDVTLAQARALARQLRERGSAPGIKGASASVTFAEAAESYVDVRAGRAPGIPPTLQPKSAAILLMTLKKWAYPTCGHMSVDDVGDAEARTILEAIAEGAPSQVVNVLYVGRQILDYATEQGWRGYRSNPFTWKGRREHNPKISHAVRYRKAAVHHAAADYRDVPQVLVELRALVDLPKVDRGNVRRIDATVGCLELMILTGVRKSNARCARWQDFDLEARLWTIPGFDCRLDEPVGTRMKMAVTHVVPLSTAAMAVIRRAEAAANGSPWLFPGMRPERPITDALPSRVLDELGYKDPCNGSAVTCHGFRSTFISWAKLHGVPFDVREGVLAHEIRGQVQRAYDRHADMKARLDALERWGTFCTTPAGALALRRGAS